MSESLDSGTHRLEPRDASGQQLREVTQPNLLREMFPYRAVPRIVFDGNVEPLDPAPDFLITDTTFRDGQQARPPYTVGQIVDLFKMLHRLGGPHGVIRQSEFFLYSTVDREAVSKCLRPGLRVSRGHRLDSGRGARPPPGARRWASKRPES